MFDNVGHVPLLLYICTYICKLYILDRFVFNRACHDFLIAYCVYTLVSTQYMQTNRSLSYCQLARKSDRLGQQQEVPVNL